MLGPGGHGRLVLCSLPVLVCWFVSAQPTCFLPALPRKFLAIMDSRIEFSLLGLLCFTNVKLPVQK